MDPVEYLRLCVELKDILLRKKAKEMHRCEVEFIILEWMKSRLSSSIHLVDLFTIYKATNEAIGRMLREETEISKSNEHSLLLSES